MSNPNEEHQDFDAEIRRLHDGRPTLAAFELDRIKARVRARKQSSAGPAWRLFLRTRSAVITAIAAGALMSTGGVALAVSGASSSGTASVAQYGGAAGPAAGGQPNNAEQSVSPVEAAEQTPTAATVSSGELPFTGFVAITLIVLGVGLAATGLVIRYVVTRRPRGAPRS